MDSAFWPHHVMIGEFIERQRKQASLGEFIGTMGENPLQSDANESSTKNDEKITIQDDTSDMETT